MSPAAIALRLLSRVFSWHPRSSSPSPAAPSPARTEVLHVFSLQSPFSGLSFKRHLVSAEIPSFPSTSLWFLLFVSSSVLLQLVASRFGFLRAERGACSGSSMRGAWILGSCLSQARCHTHQTALECDIQCLVKGPFAVLFSMLPLSCLFADVLR